MERQTDEGGLWPRGTAEETASEAAEDTASPASVDRAGALADEQRPVTGEPRVDAALASLDELEGLPVTEHRAVFEDVHRPLRDVPGELASGQPPDPGHPRGTPNPPG